MRGSWGLVLVVVMMLAAGCGGDGSPTGGGPEPLAEGSFGDEGGELDGGDVVLNIPPGAFDLERDIAVYPGDDEAPFGGGEPVYRVSGLPEQLGEPVTVRLRNQGARADGEETLVFFGEERDGIHGGRSLCWSHIASRDSAGWSIAQLPRGAYSMGEREDLDIQLIASSHAGFIQLPGDSHFRVYYNFLELEPEFPWALAEDFEHAFDAINQLGFNFGDQDSIWPLHVNIDTPRHSEWAEYYTGPWGRGTFVFSPTLEEPREDLMHFVVHELFHNAQDYFGTRHPSEWTTVDRDRLWLDEATAAALEASIGTDWVPVGGNSDNQLAPLAGIGGHPTLDDRQYGYGMSSFASYLFAEQGDERLLALYEAFYQSGKATTALMDVMDPPLEEWCTDFQKEAAMLQVHEFLFGHLAWDLWPDAVSNFDPTIGSLETTTLQVPDFGSGIWKASIDAGLPEENSDLQVTLLSSSDPESRPLDFVLYGRNDTESPVLLAQDRDGLLHDDWRTVQQTYEEIIIQVVRPFGTGPDYDNLTDVEIEVSVIEEGGTPEIPDFNRGRFQMQIESLLTDGTVIPSDVLSQQYASGTLSGNTFSATWDSTGTFGVELSGHLTVNLARSPLRVVGWSYDWTWTYPDDPDTYKNYEIVGGALPLAGEYATYTYFRHEEDAVCESLSHVYYIDVAGGVVQEELDEWTCNGGSYLNVYLGVVR